eukprot:GHVN01029149.1.p1 GENE.GHVN01029149.1~~GHVN01029149.1.p1  ORF type:complete len:369 (-),score=120.05 GHVN01029149.1:263-1369(-)
MSRLSEFRQPPPPHSLHSPQPSHSPHSPQSPQSPQSPHSPYPSYPLRRSPHSLVSFTSPTSLTLLSPAKVNLFLRILKRRTDGFHELSSLFQTISLTDEVKMKADNELDSDFIVCDDPKVPCDGTNLIAKALHVFRRHTGSKQLFRINLRKRIPSQAGLGGGSSNAATALFGANKLTEENVHYKDLLDWSSEIGADVAFFQSLGTALCTGIGHEVTPLSKLENVPASLYLVLPKMGLSTPSVYKHLNLAQVSHVDPNDILKAFDTPGAPITMVNDLEGPAFELESELGEMKRSMEASEMFQGVLMSGSGSSLFALQGAPDSKVQAFWNQYLKENTGTRVIKCMLVRRRSVDEWYEVSEGDTVNVSEQS